MMSSGGRAWMSGMRSFRLDDSVTKQKLAPGTIRRIIHFAVPYRRPIVTLLILLVVDAGIGAVNPLIYRAIINKGILGHRADLVVELAAIVAGIAVVDAGLGLVERYFSSRIGEGLIFDMRSRVFAHVQRMPIAFFSRTQTGALISRLNNDVLGAQQAFTGTLANVVSNVFSVAITLVVMFTLSWQITLVALVMLPLFVLPARWVGRKLQTITREGYNLNAAMNTTMSERFNVAGALLTKLYGRPDEEHVAFRDKASRVRDIGITSAMYGRVFFTALMLVASLASLESVARLDTTIDKQVLNDVSFRAEPGELVALVGPSGAGKTTISQLVTRMYDVTGGAVLVGGRDVRDVTLASLRNAVGVVTQDAHMFHDSIRANLQYARPDATEPELWEALRAAQLGDLVALLPDGLDTVVGDRGYRLSGGEKQRLAIARLLLKAPGIVVLDEATAHLDSESEVAVQRALKTALAGRTSLVIAHRLSTVREADRILVVDEGRVVERGRHDDLLAAGGLYAELYRTQFERQGQGGPEPRGSDPLAVPTPTREA